MTEPLFAKCPRCGNVYDKVQRTTCPRWATWVGAERTSRVHRGAAAPLERATAGVLSDGGSAVLEEDRPIGVQRPPTAPAVPRRRPTEVGLARPAAALAPTPYGGGP